MIASRAPRARKLPRGGTARSHCARLAVRTVTVLVVVLVFIRLLHADPVASFMAGAGALATVAAARWRRPTVFRGSVVAVVLVVTLAAATVALGLPGYHGGP